MAEHLLDQKYFAVVPSLVGAVLEDGLRKIAKRKGVTVKQDDNIAGLNTRLFDAKTYSPLVQKKIEVWNSIRNNADHGKFELNHPGRWTDAGGYPRIFSRILEMRQFEVLNFQPLAEAFRIDPEHIADVSKREWPVTAVIEYPIDRRRGAFPCTLRLAACARSGRPAPRRRRSARYA